ncbi:MAG: hypothetical protein WBD99_02495 [Thermodesulfobacteriota bacterium]
MYSPKIDKNLIPRLYKIAKARGVPMTELVNKILKRSLAYLEKIEAMKKQLKLPFKEAEEKRDTS